MNRLALTTLALIAATAHATAPAGRYTVTTTTVADTVTGLMWEKAASAPADSWAAAIAYCQNLTLGGYTDWRLPNVKELRTIVDESTQSPSIDTGVFTGQLSEAYWTSTPYSSGDEAYVVIFTTGFANLDATDTLLPSRCVR